MHAVTALSDYHFSRGAESPFEVSVLRIIPRTRSKDQRAGRGIIIELIVVIVASSFQADTGARFGIRIIARVIQSFKRISPQ